MPFREKPAPELAGASKEPLLVLPAGTVLRQRYRVDSFLAVGGMSQVYRAHAPHGVCLLKEVPASSPRDVISLNHEKHTLDQLHHPRIPKAYELFEEDGYYYLVLQFIDGKNLQTAVPLTPGLYLQESVVRDWALQLCDIFEYLHSQIPPIIYRDLKPKNIIKDREGQLHLVDFGVARVLKPDKNRDTELFGSVLTASPEHFGMGQTDARSDIFTLGATMHNLLTSGRGRGEEPFAFAPVRSINPRLSENLERVVQKATALRPEQRYPNVSSLRQALLNTRAEPLPVLEPYGDAEQISVSTSPQASSSHQLVLPIWLAGLVGAFLLVAGGYVAARLFEPVRPPVAVAVTAAPATPSQNIATIATLAHAPATPVPSPATMIPTPPPPVAAVKPDPERSPVSWQVKPLPHPKPSPLAIAERPAYPVAQPKTHPSMSPTPTMSPTPFTAAPPAPPEPPATESKPFPYELPTMSARMEPVSGQRTPRGVAVQIPSDCQFVIPFGYLHLAQPGSWMYVHDSRSQRVLAVVKLPQQTPPGQPLLLRNWLVSALGRSGASQIHDQPFWVNGKPCIRLDYQIPFNHQLISSRIICLDPGREFLYLLVAQAPQAQTARLEPEFQAFFESFRPGFQIDLPPTMRR